MTQIYITSTLVGFGGTCVELEGKSILENIPLGVEGAMEEMVKEACWTVLFHEFVRDLTD
jgi:ABC-type multidrug transport system fused ATPase/permease subunit